MQSFTPISDLATPFIERITRVNDWGMVMLVKASLPVRERRPEAPVATSRFLRWVARFPPAVEQVCINCALRHERSKA